jgi:hypothetical protein
MPESDDIKAACQQGVQSVVTGGTSAPDGPARDPLRAEAFRVGQASMQRASRRPGRRLAFGVLLALVLAGLLWFLLR